MLNPEISLRTFYQRHYLPHKIENPNSRNVEGYTRALDYWEALTDDPPLGEIDGNDLLLSDFKGALANVCWRCTTAPCLCGKDQRLVLNTQIKILGHVQWLIDEAGPRDRKHPTAAGVIETVPYTRKPKIRQRYRAAVPLTEIAWVKHVADQATLPSKLTACSPGDMWRALIEVMRCTSLRYGQCMALPWSAIDLRQRLMILPESICQKSKQDEPHPLSDTAVGCLLKLRGEGTLLAFGAMAEHSRTSIYKQLHRLQDYAGVSQFAFHDIRRAVLTEISQLSPAAAQLAAGHKSYETTKRYQDVRQLMAIVDALPSLDEMVG